VVDDDREKEGDQLQPPVAREQGNQILEFAPGIKYFLGLDGKSQKGWQTVGKKTYYFMENGAMALNTAIFIGDEAWVFDAEGNGTKLDMAAIQAANEAAAAAQTAPANTQ